MQDTRVCVCLPGEVGSQERERLLWNLQVPGILSVLHRLVKSEGLG